MNRDSLSGLVLLTIAAAYYWWTKAIAESSLSDEVGAAGLPRVLAVVLAGLGAILLVRSLLAARQPKSVSAGVDDSDPADENAGMPRAVGFLLLGAGYVLILPYAGYISSVALLIAAVALYEGAARRWTVPVAGIGGAILYWAIFVKLLGVNQPVGTLFQGLFS